ncbi:MAG TPA: TPM domain-containing protein [Microlunatus sp.]
MPAGDLVPTAQASSKPDLTDPFRPVHGTGPLTPHEIDRIERIAHSAEQSSGVQFSVFVGPAGDEPRAYAIRLHAALENSARSALILVDPAARVLEIITGSATRRVLSDADCRLAAASMQSSFVAHDLAGGLTAGIQQLSNSAYEAPTLHAGEKY